MNKAFEKILERFGELHERYVNQYGVVGGNPRAFSVKECMEIVQEVAEEYKGGWIPCSVRLPEESLNSVIGWDAYRDRCVFAQYIQGKFQNMGKDDSFDIKAWMPLPEPFKERD